MAIRSKTKRRVVLLLIVASMLGLGAAGFYVYRSHRIQVQTTRWRTEGMIAAQAGQSASALNLLGRYLQKNPKDAEVLLAYGQARINVQEPKSRHILEAIGIFRRVLEIQPQNEKAQRLLVDLYSRVGYNSEALALCDDLLTRNLDDCDILRARIYARSRSQMLKEAEADSIRYNGLKPDDLEMQIVTLTLMKALNESPASITSRADKLLADHPGQLSYQILQGVAREAIGDQKAGSDAFQAAVHRVVDESAPDAGTVLRLFNLLNSVGAFDEARTLLDHTADAAGSPELFIARAHMLWQATRLSDLALLLKDYQPDGTEAASEIMALKAMTLIALNRAHETDPIIGQLGKRQDDIASSWVPVLKDQLATPPVAAKPRLAHLKSALDLNPHDPYLHHLAGQAYAMLGESVSSLDEWRSAAAAAPCWPAPLLSMTEASLDQGRADLAFRSAYAAAQRAPKSLGPAIMLAQAAFAVNQQSSDPKAVDALLKSFGEIQKAQPGEPRTLPLYIELLASENQKPQALVLLEQALAANPPPGEAAYLRLLAVSQKFQLQMDHRIIDVCVAAHGETPALTYTEAVALDQQQKAQEGLELLKAHLSNPQRAGNDRDWQMVLARYEDQISDAHASETLAHLDETYPEDIAVQRLVLDSSSAWKDRRLVEHALANLTQLVGADSINARIYRARWLMSDPDGSKALPQAVTLLSQVVKSAPDDVVARLLLADCQQGVGDVTAAIAQLKVAVGLVPESHTIALHLAALLITHNDIDPANDVLQTFARSATLTPDECKQTAGLLTTLNHPDQALEVLNRIPKDNAAPSGSDDSETLRIDLDRRLGHVAEAADRCRALLKQPTPARLEFAISFFADAGLMEDARHALSLLDQVQFAPGHRDAIRGDFEAKWGDPAKAETYLRQAVADPPDSGLMHLALINFLLQRGDANAAIAACDKALARFPDNPAFKLLSVNAPLIRGVLQVPLARPLVVALILESDKQEILLQSLHILDDLLAKRLSAPDASSRLVKLADDNPRCKSVQSAAIDLSISAGQAPDALNVARRTVAAFPSDTAMMRQWAAAALAAGQWDEAITSAQRWRDADPKAAHDADLLIATAQINANQADAALKRLQPYLAAVQANPDSDPRLFAIWNRALIHLGQTSQAHGHFAPLIAKSASWRTFMASLAVSDVPDLAVASDWLTEVGQAVPADGAERASFARAWQEMGMRADRAGDLKVAQTAYRHALDLNPDLPESLNNLAVIFATNGDDLAKAVELSRKAIAIRPKDANFQDTLADIYVRANQPSQALECWRLAHEYQPAEPRWTISFANALANAGKRKEADQLVAPLDAAAPALKSLPASYRSTLMSLKTQAPQANRN